MKKSFAILASLILMCSIAQPTYVVAQCAMCSLNAENSTQGGNTQGQGLNDGILFLLAMPFIIGAGIGILWYKKYRVKESKSSPFHS